MRARSLFNGLKDKAPLRSNEVCAHCDGPVARLRKYWRLFDPLNRTFCSTRCRRVGMDHPEDPASCPQVGTMGLHSDSFYEDAPCAWCGEIPASLPE